MKFALVNDRTPRASSLCACCRRQIGVGYLHEMSSRSFYCGYGCYARDRKSNAVVRAERAHELPNTGTSP
jgi:hypothetical protein